MSRICEVKFYYPIEENIDIEVPDSIVNDDETIAYLLQEIEAEGYFDAEIDEYESVNYEQEVE